MNKLRGKKSHDTVLTGWLGYLRGGFISSKQMGHSSSDTENLKKIVWHYSKVNSNIFHFLYIFSCTSESASVHNWMTYTSDECQKYIGMKLFYNIIYKIVNWDGNKV